MVLLEPLLLLHAVGVLAAVDHDSSGPSLSLGTFENPSVRCRPRFRYWLPDAGVDKEIVSTNIKDSGERGAGGVEFVPFYNYGGEAGDPPPQANWVTNGFGTPAFRDVFRTALQAHKEAGLLMDFALGPNQGQGVPASTDDPGLQWDLVKTQALDLIRILKTRKEKADYLMLRFRTLFHSAPMKPSRA